MPLVCCLQLQQHLVCVRPLPLDCCLQIHVVGCFSFTDRASCPGTLPPSTHIHAHSHTHILQVVRSNAIGARGALALGKGLTALTCLDLTNCPIGRRASRQLDTILVKADSSALEELDNRCW